MRRPLIIALVGLILISFFELAMNNEVGHYSTNQHTDQYQSALFGGPVVLGLRDGIAWFWHTLHDSHDELLVIFTALLFGVTAYLVKYTRGLLIEARKQFPHFKENVEAAKSAAKTAQDSADAANTNAKALRLAERAYVKMSHVPPGVRWIKEHPELCEVEVEIKNYGRTPANVTDARIGAALLENGKPLPDEFPYGSAKRESFPNAFLVTNEAFFLQPKSIPLRGKDLTDTKCYGKTLWIFGHVDYIDTFNQRHRSGYVRIFNPHVDDGKRNNLFYMTERRYNYDRPRKNGEGNDWDEEPQLNVL